MAAAVASSSQSFRPLSPYQSPSLPYTTQPPPQVQQQRSANGGARISPAVLFIVVILAAIFFVSGLLHLLVRLLLKKQHGRGGGPTGSPRQGSGRREAAEDRQLQQLFHLHDSGLDQPFIDALPVFAYRDIVGGGDKEPFDCAVCLCEFDGEDRLRLLPACGHAFHLRCIDTWLLSNSTCPLCRGALFVPGMTMEESLVFDFDERLEEEVPSPEDLPRDEAQPVAEKRVFPVRLGKFKNAAGNQGVGNGDAAGTVCRREAGESSTTSSSSSLDARRCFSMGTYQYILGASELRVVALQQDPSRNGVGSRSRRRRAAGASSDASAETMEGKRICARNKGESFSVSKIWQWPAVKGKLPAGSENCSDTGSLPWMRRDATGDKSNV